MRELRSAGRGRPLQAGAPGDAPPPGTDAGADLVRLLHDEHAGALFTFCLRFTGDRQRAEDVVQEVLLRAWRQLGRLELQDRPVRPWLFTVARNLLTDLHRADVSRPRVVADDSALTGVAVVGDEMDRAVESWAMAEALRRLSAQHREVLVHSYWLGRSVTETAQVLGVPAGTVKSRTFYAVRALRLVLEEMGVNG